MKGVMHKNVSLTQEVINCLTIRFVMKIWETNRWCHQN